MIDVVTLDFWQTLLRDTPENLARGKAMRLEEIGNVLTHSGQPITDGALEAAYEASGRALARFWSKHRDVSSMEQVRIFLDALHPGLADHLAPEACQAVHQAYVSPVLHFPPEPAPGATAALTALRDMGWTLCIISNTGRTPGVILRQVLERLGLLQFFTVLSFSDELGWRKPSSAIFLETLTRAGSEPARAVHIGDDAEADVAGAKNARMRAIHYAPGQVDSSPSADSHLEDFADLPGLLRTLD